MAQVRVPTNENSSRLNWEFATDGSDIGFGVSFERTKTPDTQRSIQVIEVDGDDEGLCLFQEQEDRERVCDSSSSFILKTLLSSMLT